MLTVAEEEQRIEHQRQTLARLPGFEPYAVFSRIDRASKGFLTGAEILNDLVEQGISNFLESECQYIVKYFDSNPAEHGYPQLDYQE